MDEYGIRNQANKKGPLLFCVGGLNRIVICIPIQSLTTAAGVSSQNSYPIAQIMTVNQPRGIFGGGGVHRMWGCEGG